MPHQQLAARPAQCSYRDKTQAAVHLDSPNGKPCGQQRSSGTESSPQMKNKKGSSGGKRAQELVPPPRLEIRGKEVEDKALISPLMLSEIPPRQATAAGGPAGGGHG